MELRVDLPQEVSNLRGGKHKKGVGMNVIWRVDIEADNVSIASFEPILAMRGREDIGMKFK